MSTNDAGKPSFFARYIDDQAKEVTKQPRKSVDPIRQWAQRIGVGPKIFLMDVLTIGPTPVALIEERGAAHGFSMRQLVRAKERMGIISFKEEGKFNGRWFWARPQHPPKLPTNNEYIRRLRNVSKPLGYRLQPVGKHPTQKGRTPPDSASK
jgi:hypothetical protein